MIYFVRIVILLFKLSILEQSFCSYSNVSIYILLYFVEIVTLFVETVIKFYARNLKCGNLNTTLLRIKTVRKK